MQRHVAELRREGVTGPAGRVDHGGGRVVEGAVQRVNGEVGGVDGVEDKDLVGQFELGVLVRVPQVLGKRARRHRGRQRPELPLHWHTGGVIKDEEVECRIAVRFALQRLVQVGEERGDAARGVARRRDRREGAVLAGDHKPARRGGDDGVDAEAAGGGNAVGGKRLP